MKKIDFAHITFVPSDCAIAQQKYFNSGEEFYFSNFSYFCLATTLAPRSCLSLKPQLSRPYRRCAPLPVRPRELRCDQ